jgi:hypothetical protein
MTARRWRNWHSIKDDLGDNVTDSGWRGALDKGHLDKGALKMTINVGTFDRALRAILGVILIALPFVSGLALFTSTAATVVSVLVGLVMLAVAATRSCPLYTVLGVRTCKA